MDMRSVLQLPKNVLANMKFKWGGNSIFPSIELTGAGLLEIHGDTIWLVSTVGSGFLKCRVLWEDFAHEFKFVAPGKRGKVCQLALLASADALKQAIEKVPGKSGAHLAFVNSLVALEVFLNLASRNLMVDLEEYNSWVIATGGSADEKMSESDHLDCLVSAVRDVRFKTYPLWASLIALLPPGPVKDESETRLRAGCKSVGLDTGDVIAEWDPQI